MQLVHLMHLYLFLSCLALVVRGLPCIDCLEDEGLNLLHLRGSPQGWTIPLEYASYRLLLRVGIGGLPAQRLLLDTGSSTVAFCNTSLPQNLPASSTSSKACEQYGPSSANDHFKDGYVGPFFQGKLRFEGPTNLSVDSTYAIFAEGSCAPDLCTGKPSEGIFGVAYRKRNKAYPLSVNLSSACSDVAGDIEILCPSTEASLLPPLFEELRRTEDGLDIFGIYWSGDHGLSGALYLGGPAISSIHFDPTSPNALLVDGVGSSGWYNVNVLKIVIDGTEFHGFDCQKHSRACILDTGTPSLLLPSSLRGLSLDRLGKLDFVLEGDVEDVVLHFDLAELLQQGMLEALNPPEAFWDPLMVIGLPLWQHYYTVFRLSEKAVSFTWHG